MSYCSLTVLLLKVRISIESPFPYDLQFCAGVPIFQEDEVFLSALLHNAVPVTVPADVVIVHDGEPLEGMYLLKEGKVEIGSEEAK